MYCGANKWSERAKELNIWKEDDKEEEEIDDEEEEEEEEEEEDGRDTSGITHMFSPPPLPFVNKHVCW